ncbi:MAG: type VI-B CRISPR-associated RNA-guided ribonuclease Cas13b [Thermoguttaceae bacterium]|nr:type VI-B CRISPR-associated RNA-guided ribonuclease Cas13b [Thermoguttaceae bacterium]
MYQTEKNNRGAFWAAYFNTATNNVQAILEFAGKDVQIEELSSQEFDLASSRAGSQENDRAWATANCPAIKILKKPVKKSNSSEQLRVMKTLSKCFPFMAAISTRVQDGVRKNRKVQKAGEEMSPQKYAEILAGYLDYLYELRNYFTHYCHAPASREKMQFEYLGVLFDANVGTTKERFYSEDKISKDDRRFNNYRMYKGVETVRDENGRAILDANRNPVRRPRPNRDFLFYLWEQDSTTPKGEVNPYRELTAQGLAFFLCLFLEKKSANMLLDSVGVERGAKSLVERFGFDDISDDNRTLLKRVFTITCARLPRTRLESENQTTKQSLGLDILSYLHKCPDELYNLLSPEDQHKFRTYSEEQGTETLLKRFEDRFPYLALNALDRLECFSSLRFCIDMGNYFFRCHPRVLIDGSRMENRRLKKKLTCYTRRQDAIDYYQTERLAENTLYQTDTLAPAPKAYRTDMLPQYDIGRGSKQENRIGIALKSLGGARPMFKQPELDPDGRVKPKTYKPDAWLSTHELAPILFLSMHGKGRDVEKRIEEYVRSWQGFVDWMSKASMDQLSALCWNSDEERSAFDSRFEDQFGLSVNDIPDEFRYYLVNGKVKPVYLQSQSSDKAVPLSTDEAAEIWLVKQREVTRSLIRKFNNEQNYDFKLGKGKQRRFTSGYIALWLVRDFMRFQKANDNPYDRFGKLKSSPDFIALQASLALFDSRKDSLYEILNKARLINNKSGNHPFLKNALNRNNSMSSIYGFFKAYLEARLDWLSTVTGSKVYQLRKLYHRGNKKLNVAQGFSPVNVYFGDMAKRFQNESVCLPRGLFDDLVRSTLKELYPEQYAKDVPDGQRANFTWLMQKRQEWSGDSPQWFYRELRQSKSADEFKKLFELFGTTDIRFDAQGKKKLEEILNLTYSLRQRDLEKRLTIDRDYKRLLRNGTPKEQQDYINERMAEDDQMYRRKLNRLRDAWKNIRMSIVQDIVLLDAVWQLLGLPEKSVRLCDVLPEYDVQEQRRQRGENPELVYDGDLSNDAILNKTHELENNVHLPGGMGTITLKGEMKLKNYGNFYRMLSDPKLSSFLCLYKQFGFDSVDYAYLELQEFEYYDRVLRPAVFRMVHQLEAAVLEKYPDLSREDDRYVDFWSIAGKANGGNKFTQILLTSIRNAVSHQYYPEFSVPSDWEDPDEINEFAPMFKDQLLSVKSEFLKRRSENRDALLSETIYDYAHALFENAVAFVKQQS